MNLFGRRWRVQVGEMQTTSLDVRFKIKRSLRPTSPGTCELEVFNLTESHRAEALRSGGSIVQVEAGFAAGMSLLFRGNVRKAVPVRDGANWVVKVTGGDGEHAIRTARAARSFGPDTRLEEVVRYCAGELGVGAGNVGEQLRAASLDRVGATFPEGTLLRGRAAHELTALLRSANLEWSVQDGVLQVLPRGGALAREAIRLSPDTGLVRSPELGKNRVVKATSLLIPDLVPGRQVLLASAVVSGLHRVSTAEYSGDTHGNDWYASLELRPVETTA